jgi:lysophospholipase L1-like esterase
MLKKLLLCIYAASIVLMTLAIATSFAGERGHNGVTDKIGVWGDSIAWGASDGQGGGWVNRLRNSYPNGPEVYNLSIGGQRVKDVSDRFDREFKDLKPDVIILAIGINDSPHAGDKDGTPPDVFKKSYDQLIAKMKATGSDVVIVGLTNVVDDRPSAYGYSNEAIKPYAGIVKKEAADNHLSYVDLWGVITPDDLQGDGLHPEASGHQKIFEKVRRQLDDLPSTKQ